MNFTNLSPIAVVGGIAALAAILYALQRLRIRFQEQEVSTLLFWKEALSEAPVRTFTQRFRHFWAYLLILAICSLVWLAIAEPKWGDDEGSDFYVLLLDGSAGMAREGRFNDTVEQLQADLQRLPPSRRQVIWCGAHPQTLLNPGEHSLLLAKRLDGLAPEAVPAGIERQVQQLATIRRHQSTTQVRVYGDAPVRENVLAQLPEGIVVVKGGTAIDPVAGNSGITALGVADAASGDWGQVDLLFRIEGDDAYQPALSDISVRLDGALLPSASLVADPDGKTYRALGLAANGGLLSVEITKADSLALDNYAQIRLPNQQPIRVQLSARLPAALARVLDADSAIQLVNSDPDVVVRAGGESLGGRVPALEFMPAAQQRDAFALTYQGNADSQAVLTAALHHTGLGNIDMTGLANISRQPIEVSVEQADTWRFAVWRELLDDQYNFVQSRAFPLFVAHSVRWLAGVEQWYPYAAVSRPLPASSIGAESSFTRDDGKLIDTLGVDFTPTRTGELHRAGNSSPLSVSLLDSDTSTGRQHSALEVEALGGFELDVQRNALVWLLLLAIAGLLVEWWLYQKGRMP